MQLSSPANASSSCALSANEARGRPRTYWWIALSLREAGHDALTVLDQGLGGHADRHVVDVYKRERGALVTLDTDFANVQAFPPAEYSGLLVLRLQRQDKPHVLATFQRVMPLLETEPLERKPSASP